VKALLNDEGKRIWGYAFPDGSIPVKSPVPIEGQVVGSSGPFKDGEVHQFYLVYWERLTILQKKKILEHFKDRFGGSPQEVLAQIQKEGLPLRAKLVSAVSIPARMF
jgi:hypothetical protein